jgi:hypothetical protein
LVPASRDTTKLIKDSLLIGITDLAGALVADAPAWVAVWMLRSYEAIRYHPYQKAHDAGRDHHCSGSSV